MKVLIGGNPMGLEKAIPNLQAKYPDVEFAYYPERGTVASAIGDADVYFGWLNREAFLAAKKLRWVQSPSTGVNAFLAIPELAEGDVILTSARGTHSVCLAESVMGMILAFTRGIRESIQLQLKHQWAMNDIRKTLIELTGLTLGIVGFGSIGRALAKRAAAFDMRILATDLFPVAKPDYVELLGGLDQLDTVLREADFLVVTVPYTPEAAGLIGAAQLDLMKPSAMVVGISRGGIIDQVALAQALKEKRIASAALDVFEPEPLPADSELWDIENLLVCSHIAGGTQYEGKYLGAIFEENLGRFLKGQFPLRNQVDKKLGF